MKDLLEFLESRRSYRRFTAREVSGQTQNAILQAARLASSAANRQPLKYVVAAQPQTVQQVNALVHWAGYLPREQGTPKPEECPKLYVGVLADTSLSANCEVDAGLAMANMTAAAWAEGVGSCILGAIDRPALGKLFGLPEHLCLLYLVAFGYPAHKSTVVAAAEGNIKYSLDADRNYLVPKRPLSELVFRRL